MQKYSFEEIEKVYNNILDNKNKIYTVKEKIFILDCLLKEIKNIYCYDANGTNCYYSALNCIHYENGQDYKEYICNKIDMYLYSYDNKKSKYYGCPFNELENKIKTLRIDLAKKTC